jgi:hypothetical protein
VGLTCKFCLLSITNDVREAENKPAWEGMLQRESGISTDKIWTDEYKDTIHVFLQRLNAGFVVALGFFPVERPEGISTAVKIAYHARFLSIIGGGSTFATIVSYCLLPLAGFGGLHTWILIYHVLSMNFRTRLMCQCRVCRRSTNVTSPFRRMVCRLTTFAFSQCFLKPVSTFKRKG